MSQTFNYNVVQGENREIWRARTRARVHQIQKDLEEGWRPTSLDVITSNSGEVVYCSEFKEEDPHAWIDTIPEESLPPSKDSSIWTLLVYYFRLKWKNWRMK